jgi:hypothetical protein
LFSKRSTLTFLHAENSNAAGKRFVRAWFFVAFSCPT